jgi:hypothetical protein
METGAGSEDDLDELLERILPRDDQYQHRHGSMATAATICCRPSSRLRSCSPWRTVTWSSARGSRS